MPDPTNIVQIQTQKAQESEDAMKVYALRQFLNVFDPWYVPEGQPYAALVARAQTVLQAEQATLRTPAPSSPPSPAPEGEVTNV